MNYWQNKKQSGHTTPGTPTHPMLPVPHECPNQQTPQQIFQKLQDHTKKHDLNKIKKHIRYQPRTPPPHPKKRGVPAHCHNIPFHQYTSSQHNTQLCLKRIEQSTLLSSQTTHHTNNTTTHKHACRDHHQPVSDTAALNFERQPIQLYSLLWRNTS